MFTLASSRAFFILSEGGWSHTRLVSRSNPQTSKDAMRANQFHDKFDLLLTPTLPITAFNIGLEIPENSDYGWWPEWVAFCYPFNLTRQPAYSIPCVFTAAKLPIGLQIIGRQFDDVNVLRAATAFEVVYQQKMPVAPISAN